jgi:hypothetical protein
VADAINALQKFNSEHIEQLQFAMTDEFGAIKNPPRLIREALNRYLCYLGRNRF